MNMFLLCKWMKLKDNIGSFGFCLKKSSKWIQMITIIIIFLLCKWMQLSNGYVLNGRTVGIEWIIMLCNSTESNGRYVDTLYHNECIMEVVIIAMIRDLRLDWIGGIHHHHHLHRIDCSISDPPPPKVDSIQMIRNRCIYLFHNWFSSKRTYYHWCIYYYDYYWSISMC